MSNLKKLTAVIKTNKANILQRALIIGGTAAGAIIADGLLSKTRTNEEEEVVIVKEYETDELIEFTDETPADTTTE